MAPEAPPPPSFPGAQLGCQGKALGKEVVPGTGDCPGVGLLTSPAPTESLTWCQEDGHEQVALVLTHSP